MINIKTKSCESNMVLKGSEILLEYFRLSRIYLFKVKKTVLKAFSLLVAMEGKNARPKEQQLLRVR